MAPLSGRQISCSFGSSYGAAKVDANGYPWTNAGAGWIAGFSAQSGLNKASWTPATFPSLTGQYGANAPCTANWPMN